MKKLEKMHKKITGKSVPAAILIANFAKSFEVRISR